MSDTTKAALRQHLELTSKMLRLARDHITNDIPGGHRAYKCEICKNYDDLGNYDAAEAYLGDLALEVVRQVGSPLAVLFTVGGPNIEVVKDVRGGPAHLEGSWGSETIRLHDSELYEWVIDYYMPEEA